MKQTWARTVQDDKAFFKPQKPASPMLAGRFFPQIRLDMLKPLQPWSLEARSLPTHSLCMGKASQQYRDLKKQAEGARKEPSSVRKNGLSLFAPSGDWFRRLG